MKKEWKEQKQLLKLSIGTFCISMGHTIWVPFLIADRLGGAEAPWVVRLAGAALLGIGVILLLLWLKIKSWKEWVKLFLFFGFLQICLSLASGLLALFVLSLSRDNGRAAKEAADYGSIILALPLHAWMLCLTGHVCREGWFSFWFPTRLFLRFLSLCFLAALCQLFAAMIPQNTAGILAQGLLGGCMLFGILYWMQELTEQVLFQEQIRKEEEN